MDSMTYVRHEKLGLDCLHGQFCLQLKLCVLCCSLLTVSLMNACRFLTLRDCSGSQCPAFVNISVHSSRNIPVHRITILCIAFVCSWHNDSALVHGGSAHLIACHFCMQFEHNCSFIVPMHYVVLSALEFHTCPP